MTSSFNPSDWQNTDVDERLGPPDPGTYQVVLDDARAFTSEKGDDYVVLSFRIATGTNAGYRWDDLRSFRSEGAVRATKATCSRLGVEVDSVSSLSELDSLLKQKTGEWFTVDVKTNKNDARYRNTYVNGPGHPTEQTDIPVDTTDFQPAPVGGTADTEDDIPF